MKILVTGGAGFIGSNFVRRVVDGSLTGVSALTVLDKLTYAGTLTNLASLPTDSFEFIHGDICDSDLAKELASRHDVIVNFAAESHVDRSHGLDVRVTRCSNNYGPHQFPEKIIPFFVTNLIDGLKVPVYGNGANVRDWLHVDDHCRGIHAVLMHGRAGEVYNIGGGTELTNVELTRKILNLMGKDESSIEYVADRRGHDLRYSVDITKISNELGYKPTVDWNEGLANTVDWYQRNEGWWRPLKK